MTAGDCRARVAEWRRTGHFDGMFPEVAALRDVPQPDRYHREGDAFIHTMLAVAAVNDDADQRVFWGVLLHDIGKATTTRTVDGVVRSYGHAEAGADMVPPVMARIGCAAIADDVAWLVRHHQFHFSWNVAPEKRLSRRQQKFTDHPLFPLLVEVCRADAAGSIGGEGKLQKIELILRKLEVPTG